MTLGTRLALAEHRARLATRVVYQPMTKAWGPPTPPPDLYEPWHGTVSGYSRHRCRCTECRNAYRYYANRTRREHRRNLAEFRAQRREAFWGRA